MPANVRDPPDPLLPHERLAIYERLRANGSQREADKYFAVHGAAIELALGQPVPHPMTFDLSIAGRNDGTTNRTEPRAAPT